eukprot:Sspe_Gene.50667::Locus_28179_Transcript_10_10_Confidence_0.267_Length_1613::g.50667::m.50667
MRSHITSDFGDRRGVSCAPPRVFGVEAGAGCTSSSSSTTSANISGSDVVPSLCSSSFAASAASRRGDMRNVLGTGGPTGEPSAFTKRKASAPSGPLQSSRGSSERNICSLLFSRRKVRSRDRRMSLTSISLCSSTCIRMISTATLPRRPRLTRVVPPDWDFLHRGPTEFDETVRHLCVLLDPELVFQKRRDPLHPEAGEVDPPILLQLRQPQLGGGGGLSPRGKRRRRSKQFIPVTKSSSRESLGVDGRPRGTDFGDEENRGDSFARFDEGSPVGESARFLWGTVGGGVGRSPPFDTSVHRVSGVRCSVAVKRCPRSAVVQQPYLLWQGGPRAGRAWLRAAFPRPVSSKSSGP